METGTVARVLGPRLAEHIAPHHTILVEAPREYIPTELMFDAMRVLHGADGFRFLSVPADLAAIGDALRGDLPLLVEVTSVDEALFAGVPQVVEPLYENFHGEHLVVVAGVDRMPDGLQRYRFELHLDHRSLVVLPEEVGRIHDDIQDRGTLVHSVMKRTGGVPALCAVPQPSRPDYADRVVAACLPWAERNLDAVTADPLLELHMWTPRISSDGLALLATELLGRRTSPESVRRLRENSMFTTAGPHETCLPDALAHAIRRLLRQRDRERATDLQERLASIVTDDHRLHAPEAVRLLSAWSDWAGVDRVLAHHMHLLATFSPLQRAVFVDLWPPRVPRNLVHLGRARAFLLGDFDPGPVPPGTATAWRELTYLLGAERIAHPESLVERVRTRFGAALERRMQGVDVMRAEASELVEWLGGEIHRIEGCEGGASNCDSVLLIGLLVGAVDTSLRLGLMPEAQASVRRAMRLSRATLTADSRHPIMWPELLARAALLAAKGGLQDIARGHLEEYDEVVTHLGPRDDDTERIAYITRRYLATAAELVGDRSLRIIEPSLPFAAHEAEIEAIRALLVHGPDAAIEWCRAFLTRAAWSSRPDWAWWPVFYVMALIEAREGRPAAAQRWVERQPMPPVLDLVVRGAIELANGRGSSACRVIDQALAERDVSYRWRLLAVGLKLTCREGDAGEASRQVLLGSEDWSSAIGSVAFFPDAARQLVAPYLPVALEALPGLALGRRSVAGGPAVKLTPRQLDVLRALDSDDTMMEIADKLVVGFETIRSTAKDLYRRMNVHGRDEAVALGRELDLL